MIVILDNIRSLFNVGSIFRTADAAGVEKIYLCGITPTPTDRFDKIRPQLAKVSLGAEKTVEWEYVRSASKIIDKLKKEKIKIFAIEQDKRSIPYYESKVKSQKSKMKSENLKIALVFGNEVTGVSKSVLSKADKILEIPMAGNKESLNVSVTVGIVMFGIKYN